MLFTKIRVIFLIVFSYSGKLETLDSKSLWYAEIYKLFRQIKNFVDFYQI